MGYTEYESVYSCFLALVSCEQQPYHSQEPPRLTREDSHEKKPRITKQEFFPELATVDTAVSQTVKQRRKVPIASWGSAAGDRLSWEKFRIPTIQKPLKKVILGIFLEAFFNPCSQSDRPPAFQKIWKRWTCVLQNPDATESISLKTPLLQMSLRAKEDNQQ